jgi:nucleoside-diphosphate-sugar epimerase
MKESIEGDQSKSNMTTVKKIVVCGGNGFLGSRICKSAVARGWDVTSIR